MCNEIYIYIQSFQLINLYLFLYLSYALNKCVVLLIKVNNLKLKKCIAKMNV